MILQPIIENAIIHGLVPKTDGGIVIISMNKQNGHLQCVIEDNGIGVEASRELNIRNGLKKNSFGLELTKKRLKLINKKDLDQLIEIKELRDQNNQIAGTRVNLIIPTLQNL